MSPVQLLRSVFAAEKPGEIARREANAHALTVALGRHTAWEQTGLAERRAVAARLLFTLWRTDPRRRLARRLEIRP